MVSKKIKENKLFKFLTNSYVIIFSSLVSGRILNYFLTGDSATSIIVAVVAEILVVGLCLWRLATNKKEIETLVSLRVNKIINKMNLVKRDEFEVLKKMVQKIELQNKKTQKTKKKSSLKKKKTSVGKKKAKN